MKKRQKAERHAAPKNTSLAIGILTALLLYAMLAMAVTPERLDLCAGDIAPKTITAPRDVEDEIETELLREAAVNAVQPSYTSDETVMNAVIESLREAFQKVTFLAQLNVDAKGMRIDITPTMRHQALAEIDPIKAEEAVIDSAIQSDAATLQSLANMSVKYVRETLSAKLSEGKEAEAVSKIKRDLQNEGFSDELVTLAGAVITEYIRPNMFLDEETTEANRQKMLEEVEPVIYKKGQNIVRSGEVVTENQIAMLNNLGMLADQLPDVNLYVGVLLLLLLIILIMWVYLYAFEPEMFAQPTRIALLCVILLASVGLTMLLDVLSPYLTFSALGVMLIALLMKPRLALTANAVLGILIGVVASRNADLYSTAMFSAMLGAAVSSPVIVMMLRKRQQRSAILITGLVAGFLQMLTTFAICHITSPDIHIATECALWSGAGGLVSGIFCIGLQPVLESVFNLVTNAKLMELANPNQPLLRRLMIEAPGTYHHSIIVANIAEAATAAVGANALLARVGAYYHDIGKLKRPMYFRENQMHDNPHDRTDPRISTAILTAHTADGVELGQQSRLPDPILQIIGQHHGDTMVVYFYDKAMKQGLEVDPAQFRYKGPKPREKETAIVMLADTVEAAARAMRDSATKESMSELIHKLVRGKMDDGQLDDCMLTFRDIERICDVFTTMIMGVYHERIEYPNITIPPRKEETEHVSKDEDCLPEHMLEDEE
ncbi:MAG: HD family phosphohydrolase [Christensenellales bacterium]|jgi:putative nucleotidyltransferase with HDIG domain